MSSTAEDVLTITRNQTNLFNNMFPELEGNNKINSIKLNKDKILLDAKQKTDSIIDSWTDEKVDPQFARFIYMQKTLSAINLNDSRLQKFSDFLKIFSNKDMVEKLAKLMTYGDYISKGILGQGYEQLFKDNLKNLQGFCQPNNIDFFELIKDFSNAANVSGFEILGLLPLTCQTISKIDQTLVSYIDSEIMGHGVAYLIAENTGKYKKLIVKNDIGIELESYSIQEINVHTSVGQKNMRLMGSILIPDNIETAKEPVLHIAWAGTYSLETLLADLESSAGEESYRKGERQILDQIAEVLLEVFKKTTKPIKIIVNGHSLGGALSELTVNSIQRLLALKNEKLAEKAQKLEEQLKNNPKIASNYSLSQDFFEKLNFPQNLKVKELKLETFNATRVFDCISDNSNELCRLLVDNGISHTVDLGSIKNDAVEFTGDRHILDNIINNGCKFTFFQVDTGSPTIFSMLETAALIAIERDLQPLFFPKENSKNDIENIAGLIYFCEQLSLKLDAHITTVFTNGKVDPDSAYVIYCNKTKSGNIDPASTLEILKYLSYSSFIVKNGTELISYLMDELTDEDQVCELMTNFTSKTLSKIINNQNESSKKTLLQIAIEKGYFKLALKLIGYENIDVNLKDMHNNTPILVIMNYMNTYLYTSPPADAYKLAHLILQKTDIKLLTELNTDKNSVASISRNWNNQWWLLKSSETVALCNAIENKLNTDNYSLNITPMYVLQNQSNDSNDVKNGLINLKSSNF